ncbi:CRISPR-associated protein (Cas_Csd1) [Caballeronia sordidicola]|uniref:CRISPR-associated protein (Cas_Csd1) n=1 Tax=Caballeronia sordidicola TaxID=196367 RepID=A0A158FAC6_CABSO|nr:type I-C CRISPR-associated protein Cas8c/Csd1 [Caballeronia sordidicola]SAL16655.1 CRISPR-associated protein (Cas_Csd1) [Caballeronia sordidicola]
MIIKSLAEYYERLAAQGKVPAFGLTQEKIGYSILLDHDGKVRDIVNLSDPTEKKSKWLMLTVPASFKRSGTAPPPFFLWDKSAFVLGVEQKKDSDVPSVNARSHGAFKALHLERLANATDAGLVALRKFVEEWVPEQWQQCEALVKHGSVIFSANIVFRLDGEQQYIHERAAAQELIKRYSATDDSPLGLCLVSGETQPIARLHPAIKGVWGAQSAGASIVSFNLDAFDSYGKDRGANAPVSVHAAFAYTTVLNYLLMRDPRHRQCVQIGDASVVFWAEAKDQQQQDVAENLFFSALEPPPSDSAEASKLLQALDAVAAGRAMHYLNVDLDPATKIFVLGLSPNASRLSVRYWFTEGLGKFAQRLAQHYGDLAIEPLPWKTPPAAWRLLASIAAQEKTENVQPVLAGSLMRSVLSGERYPRTLLSAAIMRMRADHDISGLRVALCKAVLTRDQRLDDKNHHQEVSVSLDRNVTTPGYLLGRLFAVLESIQEAALHSVNASIKDRYYGSASAMPAGVFPLLMRGAQNHLSKALKDPKSKGLAVSLEKEAQQIIEGLSSELPKTLRLEDQGRFAIGYYHQRNERFRSKADKNETRNKLDETLETI